MTSKATTAGRNAAGAGPSQRVIVFDVIETLLDLRALAPAFEQAFGDSAVLQQWFSQMLQSAFAITVAGIYVDFGAVARGPGAYRRDPSRARS